MKPVLQQQQPFAAVILAGGLRPSPLQQALELPPAVLPIAPGLTLGQAWLRLLAASRRCRVVRIALSTREDARLVGIDVAGDWPMPVQIVTDPEPCRGTAGVLRDLTRDLPCSVPVVAIEASALPPRSLDHMVDLSADDESLVVGVDEQAAPAGVFTVRAATLDGVPRIGFCDFKEQFVTSFVRNGGNAIASVVTRRTHRLRNRESYIAAVSAMARRVGGRDEVDHRASVIAESAEVDPGAIVVNSVIMAGAVVEAGAVVARSVVGPNLVVTSTQRLVDTVLGDARQPPTTLVTRLERLVSQSLRRSG